MFEMFGGIKIQCSDCLDIDALRSLEDNSVHLACFDPPYFIDGMDDKWDSGRLSERKKKAKVVGALPVGMKFDVRQGINLQRFMEKAAREIYRIIMPGAFLVSFAHGRLYHRLAIALENQGFEIRDMLIWKRESQAKAFSQDHFVRRMRISEREKQEIIDKLDGRKTPQLKSQSEPIVLAQKPKDGTFIDNWLKWETGLVDIKMSLDGKFPGTVMDVRKPGKKEKLAGHLTPKPLPLIEHLIRLFTKQGQTVLDPFLGSGTTAVACIRADRKCIGFEKDRREYNACKERIEEEIGRTEGRI